MRKAVVALGANLGDAAATLRAAAAELEAAEGVRIAARSRLYATSPVDSSGPDYVNAAVLLETALPPMALLRLCQSIENRHGRVRPAGVVNAPRTLDLDVIAYEGTVQSDPVLTLPHPRAKDRLFVLVPLSDIAPDWPLADGRSVAQAIADVRRSHPEQKIRLLATD